MLRRRLSLLQAVSLNMAMMVGIGPFITMPALVKAMGGPQALLGWVVGALVALGDGLVWSELAAAFPGSGGTYHFFDAVYGNARAGRLLKFLFVWQFLFSGPLELASGALGLAHYTGFFWPALQKTVWSTALPNYWHAGTPALVWTIGRWQIMAVGVMAALVALAYRRIEAAGRLMVVLWLGMLATVCWVIVDGLVRFNPAIAFDFPPGAWTLDGKFAFGLGAALGIVMYDFLGYYQVCYLGDEVVDPARTIPRSILISVVIVAIAYMLMNLSLLGVIPWRRLALSEHAVSDFMQELHGPWAAGLVTLLIVWTAVAGTFAALLSYSRVPYAAAKAGHFFAALAKTHPTGEFPHRSLLLLGAVAIVACLADLESVIFALLTSRILIQFVGQVGTVIHLRKRPEILARMPFRMALYPLPALISLCGWLYVFGTSAPKTIAYGLLTLVLGLAAFVVWDRGKRAVISPPK